MKKSSIIAILVIFTVPLALYYFFKMPNEAAISNATPAKTDLPKLMQFTSAMCYDCKRVEKELAPLRKEYSGKVVFQKFNVSTRTEQINKMIEQYDINVVPTLIFLDKNGNFIRKTEGYVPKTQLTIYLNEAVSK